MSLTPKQRLYRAVRRIARAEVNESWKGSMHPDDHEQIERERELAWMHYQKLVNALIPEE